MTMNFDECEYCSKDGDQYLLDPFANELWCVCKSCRKEMFKRELASGEVKVISKKEYAMQYLKEEFVNGALHPLMDHFGFKKIKKIVTAALKEVAVEEVMGT